MNFLYFFPFSRKYKFAVEEKEAAVSEAMGRYRKMQRELEDAEERAERAEGTASTLRARSIRFACPQCLAERKIWIALFGDLENGKKTFQVAIFGKILSCEESSGN